MSEEQASAKPLRRSRAEAEQLAAEFEASGLRRQEFCRNRGLKVSTLDAYRKRRRQRQRETVGGTQWVAVEVRSTKQGQASGLAVLLGKGRRIEVSCGFDAGTMEELVSLLERV